MDQSQESTQYQTQGSPTSYGTQQHTQQSFGDGFEITVEVTDPKIKDGVQKYTTYTVRGMDRIGLFDVQRRYNDFQIVRSTLLQKWPGCFIPPLPPKKAIGNMDQKFIDDRMKYLNDFCRKVAVTKYLWYSDEFQIFVKTQGEIEKTLQQVPKITNEEIINKYQETFAELSGKEINMFILAKINDFNSFLKRISPMIDNFKQIAKNICKAKQDRQESLIKVLRLLLPEYEKNLLLEYGDQKEEKLIISNQQTDSNLHAALDRFEAVLTQQDFSVLYEQIRLESKELEAFTETFAQREKYESQKLQTENKQKELQIELQSVLAGKTTFKSLFTKGNKEETIQKLQQQIDQSNREIENMSFICDILTVLLGYIEIDRFKAEKQQVFYTMVKRIIQFEIELAKATQEFWERVQQNYYLI